MKSIDDKDTDDGDGDSDGVDLSDKSVDVSAAYTALLAKCKALLNQVSGIKKKGFGILFRDEEDDELYVHDNYDDDSDDEEEEIIAKPAKKKNMDLSKKEMSA
jgi:hypothetical protein